MNEKILGSLIQILQKHANAIRKLQVANMALMDLARRNSALSSEEFEQQLLETLSSFDESGPAHNWHQSIAKEIEETIDLMNLIENQQKESLN